jgi:hypothetical protein
MCFCSQNATHQAPKKLFAENLDPAEGHVTASDVEEYPDLLRSPVCDEFESTPPRILLEQSQNTTAG